MTGRPAQLPPDGYDRPNRLDLHSDRLVVTFVPTGGGTPTDYDFTDFPVPRATVELLATAFARATGPGGRRTVKDSADRAYRSARHFASYLSTLPDPPDGPQSLRPTHLDGWGLALGPAAAVRLCDLVPMLRRCGGYSPDFERRLSERGLPKERSGTKSSYSPEDHRRIVAAARADVRAAAARIRRSTALLARWRDGRIDPAVAPADWHRGRLLDHADRHGDVPRDAKGKVRWSDQAHGTVLETMLGLNLGTDEVAAFVVLLIDQTGHNGGTLGAAPVVHSRTDGDAGGTRVAVVKMTKRRRGPRRAVMNVPLVDLPAWAGPAPENAKPGDAVTTAYGLFMLAVELTASARRNTGSDRLLLSWAPSGYKVGRGYREGLTGDAVNRWGTARAISPEHPAEPDETITVDMARLRLTHAVTHQKPVAHTPNTLGDDYLLKDRRSFPEYQRLVARTLEEQRAKAAATSTAPVMTADDVNRAERDPETAAAEHGVNPATLKQAVAGDLDTPLGACLNHLDSPHAPEGQPCRASFLRCLGCPCARAMPRHVPVQALVLDAVDARRADLTPLDWARRYGLVHAQLNDLLSKYQPAAVAAARDTATDEQRRLVRRLMDRGLDL